MALISTSLQDSIASSTGLGATSPESVVTGIVSWLLGILAIIAVVLVIVAGFQWMTSGGNEEKVQGAQKLLRSALIGLMIIMAAYGIARYAIQILATATATKIAP